jgi:transposase
VLDASGFPKKSRIFPGNVSEPATLKEMIDSLSGNDDASQTDNEVTINHHDLPDHITLKTTIDQNLQTKPQTTPTPISQITIVMDAGIATENNIAYLKEHNYRYIVVSRNHNLTMPDSKTIIVKEDPGNEVTAALVVNDQTDEVELYCHSQAKEAKASEILTKITQRYETELNKLHLGLTKPKATKQYDKILTKLGRLAEKYKTVHMLYNIAVIANQDKKDVIAIKYSRKENLLHKKESGIYCLRSNRKDLDAKTLWETYTMLTDLEAAFRSLKSELGFRPVYHQKEARVDGHLFISILAYHLLHTIRYQLKQHDIHHSWESLRRILNRQFRVTSNLQLADGRSVNIRKTSAPNADQLAIYRALGISSMPGKVVKTYTEGRLDNF